MKVWTVQTLEAWQEFQRLGVLRVRPDLTESDFRLAYDWMVEQATHRIGSPPPEVRYPIWVWAQCHSEKKAMPDLRHKGHLLPGTPGVRLELDVDPSQLLLSDFMGWHFALSYWFLPSSQAEDEAFDAELTAKGLSYHDQKPLPALYDQRVKKSWEKIFDMDWCDPSYTHPKAEKIIQGVMWELHLEQVRKARPFTAV